MLEEFSILLRVGSVLFDIHLFSKPFTVTYVVIQPRMTDVKRFHASIHWFAPSWHPICVSNSDTTRLFSLRYLLFITINEDIWIFNWFYTLVDQWSNHYRQPWISFCLVLLTITLTKKVSIHLHLQMVQTSYLRCGLESRRPSSSGIGSKCSI